MKRLYFTWLILEIFCLIVCVKICAVHVSEVGAAVEHVVVDGSVLAQDGAQVFLEAVGGGALVVVAPEIEPAAPPFHHHFWLAGLVIFENIEPVICSCLKNNFFLLIFKF